MYWYKRHLLLISSFILLLGIASCKRDSNAAADTKAFFNIKGYFEADSARLTKENPLVTKTVTHNQIPETQKVHISDWGTELSLFTQSDINRPAWRNSYNVSNTENTTLYIAKDPSLKTQRVIVKTVNGKLQWIVIFNHTKNILYENTEKLSYFPDSLYLIQKRQSVRLLGTDTYRISGLLK
ncbi:MAG: hypothetical protein JST50_17130 [Bacteroidetes bacterium]|jgi:hypothetical protein|nr:hypothetical protein [Bacteroidota bacterium]